MFYVYVILVSLVVLAAGLSWFLRKHRRDVWQQWAHSKRLTYLAPPAGPRITGQIGRYQVTVESHAEGSDTEGPVEIVRFCVTLEGLPANLDAEGVPGLIGELAQLGEDRILTGDETFDRDVIVRANENRQEILDFWTPVRREAFLKLVNEAPCDQILLQGETLIGEEREIISSQQHLDRLADALLSAADVLNGEKD